MEEVLSMNEVKPINYRPDSVVRSWSVRISGLALAVLIVISLFIFDARALFVIIPVYVYGNEK